MREAPIMSYVITSGIRRRACTRTSLVQYTFHTVHVRTQSYDTDGPSIQTDHRYRRFMSLLRLYRVSIDRLYRRNIEYRDVCIEYRRAGLGISNSRTSHLELTTTPSPVYVYNSIYVYKLLKLACITSRISPLSTIKAVCTRLPTDMRW